jgi:hypothetical protein
VAINKEHTMDSLELSGGSLNSSFDQLMPLQFVAIGSEHGANVVPSDDNIEKMTLPISKCPIRMTSKDIKNVIKLNGIKKGTSKYLQG